MRSPTGDTRALNSAADRLNNRRAEADKSLALNINIKICIPNEVRTPPFIMPNSLQNLTASFTLQLPLGQREASPHIRVDPQGPLFKL